ncbi:beta strand repeat-containing protein [Sphingopyxis sp. QXT-31]|uniref:beta strand repeat-containing protein n=1 Tax=Sphingopyxis sp. QXT-31 TaxID=1357916 RepID=UPI0012EB1154|nr:autotransporter domain-containing protein [Sphingopyxis sp. QXT-31]
MAMLLLAMPGTATAQDECGAAPATAGTVTCSPDGNPYNNGVTYIVPPSDLTIVLQDGVRIDTSGTFNIGILAVGDSALTVDGGTNTLITTDSDGGFGALISNNVDPISVTLDRILTTGDNAIGVVASSSEGNVSVDTNAIRTFGDGAGGISASTDIGDIRVQSNSIRTAGTAATAIDANSDFGNIDITSGTIITEGGSAGFLNPGSIGILAQTGGTGTIAIDSDNITTSGADAVGIRAINGTGGLSVTSGTIGTSGLNADAINVTSAGTVTVDGGTITTTGANADGIVATGVTGANVNFTSISTTGDNANGVLIPAAVLFFGPQASATATVNGDSISTAGATADGVRAIAGTGAAAVNVTGNITTQGANSRGIFATGPGGVTVTNGGTISTAGGNSNAVDVASTAGPVVVNVNDVRTTGQLSGGVRAIGGTDSNVTVIARDVTTTGTAGSDFFFLPNSTAVVARASGTGDVAVTTRNVSTAGLSAAGVDASAATGDVIFTTGDIVTTGGRANGVTAESGGGNVIVSTGNIATGGDNSDGVSAIANNGSVTVDTLGVTTTGFAADGISAVAGAGGADIGFTSVTAGGTLTNGVSATSTGGNVVIRGANATSTGQASTAIFGSSDSGEVSVFTTGNVVASGRGGSGIFAVSDTGGVSVSANNVSTLATLADDTGAARAAIFASGANTNVTVSGSAITTGTAEFGGNASAVTALATNGNANVIVNNASSSGAMVDTVVVTATGDAAATVNGRVQSLGAGGDALVVTGGDNATVSLAANGNVTAANGNSIVLSSVNGSTLNNAGTIANNANGFAVLATGGPIVINNSGNLSSDIRLTAGADRVDNSGIFTVGVNPDFGGGIDVFANSGTILIGSGATAVVTPTFTGLESLANSGTIDLRNGRAGDTLTLPGTYAGANGTLGLDILTGTTTVADQLIVGGLASGNTIVVLNQAAGSTPVFNPGTVVVRAGIGSAADAFDLAGGSQNLGFVRFEIQNNAADGTFFLTAAPSDAAFRTINYSEGVRSLWLKSADVVSAQLRARRDALWTQGGGDVAGRTWIQIHGSVEKREGQRSFNAFGQSGLTNTGYQQDYFGGQLGFDVSGGSGEPGGFAFGVTGGYLTSSMNFAGSADRLRFDVVNGGAYGSYSAGNFFVNALGKYDYIWADTKVSGAGFQQDLNGSVYGARGEAGFRFGNDSFFVEPAASISYVKNDFDDLTPLGTTIGFDEDEGLRGRFGGRIGGSFNLSGSEVALYAGGNYVREFKGKDRVIFTGGGQTLAFTNNRIDDYGEAIVGVTIAQSEGVSGFFEGHYTRSFGSNNGLRDREGAGGRAGIRIKF